MLVISRFRYDDGDREQAMSELVTCLDVLGARPGFVSGAAGRAVDDASLWVLQTRWQDVGSYRRALASYDVKVSAVPLLSRAIDEPSAYEVLLGEGATTPNEQQPRRV